MTSPKIPTLREFGQAFIIAVYTCAMTFFAGLIGHGGLENWPDWKIAVQAGIAAGLAWVGWTVKNAI